jgi:hypothetical protein
MSATRIHVPGLELPHGYLSARRRLLADFPDVRDVLVTTGPEALLVSHSGPDERDAWRRAALESIGASKARSRPRPPRGRRLGSPRRASAVARPRT